MKRNTNHLTKNQQFFWKIHLQDLNCIPTPENIAIYSDLDNTSTSYEEILSTQNMIELMSSEYGFNTYHNVSMAKFNIAKELNPVIFQGIVKILDDGFEAGECEKGPVLFSNSNYSITQKCEKQDIIYLAEITPMATIAGNPWNQPIENPYFYALSRLYQNPHIGLIRAKDIVVDETPIILSHDYTQTKIINKNHLEYSVVDVITTCYDQEHQLDGEELIADGGMYLSLFSCLLSENPKYLKKISKNKKGS